MREPITATASTDAITNVVTDNKATRFGDGSLAQNSRSWLRTVSAFSTCLVHLCVSDAHSPELVKCVHDLVLHVADQTHLDAGLAHFDHGPVNVVALPSGQRLGCG